MASLSFSTLGDLPLAVKKPQYNVNATRSGIVHLGPGAFHRAHQAVYTDLAMAHGGNWRIDAVSLRSKTLKHTLANQDNLYSLAILDEEPYRQIIGAINQVFVLDEDRSAIMASLVSPSTHIISLTITEKGYCLDSQGQLDMNNPDIQHDLNSPQTPVTAIGLLVETLRVRKALALNKLTIISCDNVSNNGSKLGAAVIALAQRRDNELAHWISDTICFPNTMVDSITPATDASLRDQTESALGVRDAWPIQREAFAQWVIEDKFSGPRPAWEKVGVTFTDDVNVFEKAKLRVLNGAHSTLAYMGLLFNFDTVFEAMSHSGIEAFIRRLIDTEILPTIDAGEKIDLSRYAEAILSRFHNRHIRHLLSQIAWDGSQKLPLRILNTIRDRLKANASIHLLAVPIAAWLLFIAMRQNQSETITDPKAEHLLSLAQRHNNDIHAFTDRVLNESDVFAELSNNQTFRTCVHAQVEALSNTSLEICLAKL
ncbi:MAG: mannitol dehydrogenase family protein [Pseudomonadota bacterium]